MSGFMFGGSALTLDIGVRNDTGGAVVAGDIMQIVFLLPVLGVDVGQDGFGAITPGAGGADNGWADNPMDPGSGFFSVTGSVVAPVGLNIPALEAVIIRVGGPAQVQVLAPGVGGIAVGDLLDISPGNDWLVISAMNGGNIQAATSAAAVGLIRGTALETVAAGATAVINVWLRPFGGAS